MKTSGIGEMSRTSEISKIPSNFKMGGKVDYLKTNTLYKKF
jgi:hypothetical protein